VVWKVTTSAAFSDEPWRVVFEKNSIDQEIHGAPFTDRDLIRLALNNTEPWNVEFKECATRCLRE
jgi:hypothetical protein